MYKILTINPGSTSTKIGVYEGENLLFSKTIRHQTKELEKFKTIYEQYEFRKNAVLDIINDEKFDLNTLDAVVGRGGVLKPIEGGTYRINDNMLTHLKEAHHGEHASNLGAVIAREIGDKLNIP
jgi:butyrate kinase